MFNFKWPRIAALMLGLVASVSLLPAGAESLRIGVQDVYPPFSFIDDDGNRTGFDVEISRALCAEMETDCTVKAYPFDELIPLLQENKLDIVVAGMFATPERQAVVSFTDPYYHSLSIYVAAPGTILSNEGLQNKKLGAQIGSAQAAYAQKRWNGIAIIKMMTYQNLLAALQNGSVDVILLEGLPGYDFLLSDDGKAFDVIGEALPPEELDSSSRIAVRRGNDVLRAKLNAALADIRLNGEYDKVNRLYFDYSIY